MKADQKSLGSPAPSLEELRKRKQIKDNHTEYRVVQDDDGNELFAVWFVVGHQSFELSYRGETIQDAEWMCISLATAIAKLIG